MKGHSSVPATVYFATTPSEKMDLIAKLGRDYVELWNMVSKKFDSSERSSTLDKLAQIYTARVEAVLRGDNPYRVMTEEKDDLTRELWAAL